MKKKSPKATQHFSAADVRRLHDLLSKRTVAAYWDAGRLLNSKFDGRADHGSLATLERRLKKHGGGVPTSADQLHKCRVLARVLDRNDVAAASKTGLKWFRVIIIIFILAMAKRISDKKRRWSIIAHCKKLISAYPGGGDKDAKARWFDEVTALKATCLNGQSTGMTHRLFNEKRLAVQHRIDDLLRRMGDAQALLPINHKRRGMALLSHVSLLKTEIDDFYTEVNAAAEWK